MRAPERVDLPVFSNICKPVEMAHSSTTTASTSSVGKDNVEVFRSQSNGLIINTALQNQAELDRSWKTHLAGAGRSQGVAREPGAEVLNREGAVW